MGKIVLLASYPKSGNTWIRAFLTSLWRDGTNVNINRLMVPNASSKDFIESLLGTCSSDFGYFELANLRPELYDLATRRSPADDRVFLKIHDAFLSLPESLPAPIHRANIDRVVYVVRDPRSIAPSLARHLGTSIDRAIGVMGNPHYKLSFYPRRVGQHVPQLLSTWSVHVKSWLSCGEVPVQVIRYEDMLENPPSTFRAMLQFLEVEASEAAVVDAIQATQLSVLMQKERTGGFAEKPPGKHRFFHGGVWQPWRTTLTLSQSKAIETTHGAVMNRLGYLP
jgi:aryl sulfotransferase